jgi:hypothetical protein
LGKTPAKTVRAVKTPSNHNITNTNRKSENYMLREKKPKR